MVLYVQDLEGSNEVPGKDVEICTIRCSAKNDV